MRARLREVIASPTSRALDKDFHQGTKKVRLLQSLVTNQWSNPLTCFTHLSFVTCRTSARVRVEQIVTGTLVLTGATGAFINV